MSRKNAVTTIRSFCFRLNGGKPNFQTGGYMRIKRGTCTATGRGTFTSIPEITRENIEKRMFGAWKSACAIFLFFAATVIGGPAQTFTSLYSLAASDGHNPMDALIQGFDGNFYGTTYSG